MKQLKIHATDGIVPVVDPTTHVPPSTVPISESSIVAAAAFVKAGFEMPPRMLGAAMPAKAICALSDEESRWKSSGMATYQDRTRRSPATMEETMPLVALEPGLERIHMPDVVPLVELRMRAG